jgi:hypothetical protein
MPFVSLLHFALARGPSLKARQHILSCWLDGALKWCDKRTLSFEQEPAMRHNGHLAVGSFRARGPLVQRPLLVTRRKCVPFFVLLTGAGGAGYIADIQSRWSPFKQRHLSIRLLISFCMRWILGIWKASGPCCGLLSLKHAYDTLVHNG